MKLKVFAKVNLSLNILGVEGNMHLLDTVMTSVDLADVISVSKANKRASSVRFFPSNPALERSNSVTKIIDEIHSLFDDVFVDVEVTKQIPLFGGLGGSSADAAGALFAIDKIYDLQKRGFKPIPTALKVGSDVPYMLSGGFARVLSTGNEVQKQDFFREIFFVICKGRRGVSSANSYKRFDEIFKDKRCVLSDNDALLNALKNENSFEYLEHIDNALFKASVSLEPSINSGIYALMITGAKKSFMTGSGASCVGIFDSFDKAIASKELLLSKGYFAEALKSVPHGIQVIED